MYPFPPFNNILVSGVSGAGKSQFVNGLCQHADKMFTLPPSKILYFYKHWQQAYEEVTGRENVQFMQSVPEESEIRTWSENQPHTLLVFDDFSDEIGNFPIFEALFLRLSHHLKLSVIYIVQSGALRGPHAPAIFRNTHTNVILRSAREHYFLRNLGVLLNKYRLLKEAYADATSGEDGKFGYIVIDTHPTSPSWSMIRSKVMVEDPVSVVYKEKEN